MQKVMEAAVLGACKALVVCATSSYHLVQVTIRMNMCQPIHDDCSQLWTVRCWTMNNYHSHSVTFNCGDITLVFVSLLFPTFFILLFFFTKDFGWIPEIRRIQYPYASCRSMRVLK